MALSQTRLSRMTCALMEPQPVIVESQNAMNAVDGAKIERRIRINRPDEGRGRCKGSRAWDPRKDFSRCKQQHKIKSTSNVILPQEERTELRAFVRNRGKCHRPDKTTRLLNYC